GARAARGGGHQLVRRVGAARVVAGGAALGVGGFAGVDAAPDATVAVAAFLVAGLGIAVIAPLSFAAVGAAVPPGAADAAIARMNIANYVGAILGGAVIGAVAQAGSLRLAFLVPLVLVAPILLLSRSFADPGTARVG
ncbi:MFS transporter, partial [Aeromicrobium sp.]|uniref:MFS transporter n=1 Tax=Aeromicrobium sp. TaxID=1871063 RepID=UPI00351703DD